MVDFVCQSGTINFYVPAVSGNVENLFLLFIEANLVGIVLPIVECLQNEFHYEETILLSCSFLTWQS